MAYGTTGSDDTTQEESGINQNPIIKVGLNATTDDNF